MRFHKAVITAAGPDQRALPLQTLIDRDGREKSVLGILIEQALAAGVEEICVAGRGAAYYGLTRHRSGVRIRGGVPRTYYVGVEISMPSIPASRLR